MSNDVINLGAPLQGTNGQLMVLAALRYCLGRQSYIVSSCQEWLKANWSLVDDRTRGTIVRDIVSALIDNDAGSKYDFDSWRNFGTFAWDTLSEEERAWVVNDLAYKTKGQTPSTWFRVKRKLLEEKEI